ncbi:multidrug effflux MFS transporter [Roseateles sp. DAIF2]|nr:multidrug effflux MFS transporter [Roseateles sp. DAIF2]
MAVPALALLLGLQPVTTDLYLPALPALRADLGAGMGAAQLTLSALMMAFGLGQLLLGPVADRVGRRPVLLAGLTLYVLAALGGALAQRIEPLIVWRALQGLGLAAAVVCGRAMLRDWFEPQQGAQVMARALTGLGLIAMLSPSLGGLLAGWLGWRAALLATGLAGAATLALIALRVPESLARPNPRALHPGPLLHNWWTVARHPVFVAYALLTAFAYATLYSFLAGSSFVFIGLLGVSREAYGLVLGSSAAVYIGGTFACRHWLPRLGLAATVKRGAVFTLCGSLLMGGLALAGFAQVATVLLPHWIIIFGHGVLQPCGQAGAVGPFPRQAGAASALSGFLIALMAFGVGAWLSWVLDGRTVLPLALSIAGFGLLTVAIAWTLVQRKPPLP